MDLEGPHQPPLAWGSGVSVCIIVLTVSPSPYSDDHHVFKRAKQSQNWGATFPFPSVWSQGNRVHGPRFSCTWQVASYPCFLIFSNEIIADTCLMPGTLLIPLHKITPYTQPVHVLPSPFSRWGNWGRESFTDLRKVLVVFEPRKFGFRVYLIFTL